MALPSADAAKAQYPGKELYFNGSSWVPQYTSGGQAVTQAQYNQTYNPAPSPTPAPTNNNNNNNSNTPAQPDYAKQMTDSINSGYNDYFSQLDSMLNNDLPTQRAAQEGIATSQGKQATTTLTGQKEQGLVDLGAQTTKNNANQVKSLTDLAENIRNQFKAGNIFLGARGAGDSSAANQYSYAIAKMGTKARGDVLGQTRDIQNQIDDRTTKLKTTYDTELNNITESVNQKMLEVANWFSQAQSQLKQAKANGQLQKGKDLAALSSQLLTQATNQMLIKQQEAATQKSMLDQWALNNAKTVQDVKTNMAGVSNYQAANVNTPTINGGLQVSAGGDMSGVNYNPGSNNYSTIWDELKKLQNNNNNIG